MLISLFIIGLLFIDHNDSKPSNNNETTTVLKSTNSSNTTRLNKGQLWLDYLFSLMDKAEFLDPKKCSDQRNIICKFSNMIDWFVN
ncbi:unnamed protein product [Schistosoma haematobium]|nr:unnamed protein product [Schistosoma haematobium]